MELTSAASKALGMGAREGREEGGRNPEVLEYTGEGEVEEE